MAPLSDEIEQFIKGLMQQEDAVCLQRNELAQHFACAPSQINYVLATRFSIERGYITASKRGGGGYIRIERIHTDCLLHELICSCIWDALKQRDAYTIVMRLFEEGVITAREANMILWGLESIAMPTQELQDAVRACVLRNMLKSLLRNMEDK